MENLQLDQCLQKVLEGDMSGLEELYNALDKAVYMLALSIVRDKDLAQDILQDTFINVRYHADTYRPHTNVKAWVLTIARNLSISYLRKRKRETLVEDVFYSEQEEEFSGAMLHEEVENAMLIELAFTSLNEKERSIVSLHALSGLKHREIAQILEMPLGSVLWSYNNALKKMHRYFEERKEKSKEGSKYETKKTN